MMQSVNVVIENYVKSGSRWKLMETKNDTYTADQYYNSIDSGWTSLVRSLGGYERVEKNYTCFGYIPVKITSISPDREKRTIHRYVEFS